MSSASDVLKRMAADINFTEEEQNTFLAASVEIERLEKENFSLAANQCNAGYSGEHGDHMCGHRDAEKFLLEALEQCAESLAFARDKLGYVGEGDHKDRKGDGTDPTGSFLALNAARNAISKAKRQP